MQKKFKNSALITSNTITVGNSKFYGINMGAVLGQISTGGKDQLEEQLSAIDCLLEREVTSELLAAGKEDKRTAEEKKTVSSRCTCYNSSCRCWMEQT